MGSYKYSGFLFGMEKRRMNIKVAARSRRVVT